MNINQAAFDAISNLKADQVLECKTVANTVTFVPVQKSAISWGRKFQAFFGFGPYKLSNIAHIVQGAITAENASTHTDVINKLNTRIDHFNKSGLRKYFSFLHIQMLSLAPHKRPEATPEKSPKAKPAHVDPSMRICSHDPIASYSTVSLQEIKDLAAKITDCFSDTEIQKSYYKDHEHPGELLLDIRDIQQKFPEAQKYTGSDFKKALLYMLLQGDIYSISNSVPGLICIGIDASKATNHEKVSNFYNREQLVQLDQFIRQNTLTTPDDAPEELKPLIDHIAVNFNKQLYNIYRNQEAHEPVLAKNDLYKIGQELGLPNAKQGYFPEADRAMTFLTKKQKIHAWNFHFHSGYFIQFRESDKRKDAAFDKPWRTT